MGRLHVSTHSSGLALDEEAVALRKSHKVKGTSADQTRMLLTGIEDLGRILRLVGNRSPAFHFTEVADCST